MREPGCSNLVRAHKDTAVNQIRQGTVQRAAAWSEVAFKEVYSRYVRPVYSYILRRVRNHHDAEDLAAHVFFQVLNHLEPKEINSPELQSWIYTSARNASANLTRARRFVVSIEETEPAEEADDPGRALLDEEEIGRLLDAIARLPDEKRKALILRFVDQLPHAEVAEALGRSESSSRVLLHRTLAQLRKQVS